MLTPAQIRGHRFTTAVRGSYKAEEVDSYFEEVAASYEQAFKENAELVSKIKILADKVDEYRKDEDNIKSTLLTAQRVADGLLKDAEEKSEEMIKSSSEKLEYAESKAKVQAQIILDDANKTARDTLYEAENKAKKEVEEAQRIAHEIVDEAKRASVEELSLLNEEIKKEKLCFDILKKEATAFKGELLEKYRQHIEFIGAIPVAVAATILPKQYIDEDSQDADRDDIEGEETVSEEICPDDEEDTEIADATYFEDKDEIQEPEESAVFDGLLEDEDSETSEEAAAIQINTSEDAQDAEEAQDGIEQKDIDDAIGEIEGFLSENEDILEDSSDESDEQYNEDDVEDDEVEEVEEEDDISEPEAIEDIESKQEDINKGELPSLFGLRQTAMAQQQEMDDLQPNDESHDEEDDMEDQIIQAQVKTEVDEDEPEEEGSQDETDDDGFRVYLENLDADDETLSESAKEDAETGKSLFETVEYDEDDEDEDEDEKNGDTQPRFKGFFKK
jgi:cell division initiation protein